MVAGEVIKILDFGSQYSQLIARRVREIGVYSELLPYNVPISEVDVPELKGIILSGGPASVLNEDSPDVDSRIFDLGVPVLGICYGMQLIAKKFGGKLARAKRREYGPAKLFVDDLDELLAGVPDGSLVWMSHGDNIEEIPPGFVALAHTETLPIAAMADTNRRIYATQFHPEVRHTEYGIKILENFVRRICGCTGKWDLGDYARQKIEEIRSLVGEDERVVLAYSGGVDSTVVAAILVRAVGERLVPIFVDNGLLRLGEPDEVRKNFFELFGFDLHFVDASETFLKRLSGVTDPEKKRKIIGHTFIEIFEREAKSIPGAKFLAQGTLYPDVIESTSYRGPSATIKTHHNVGGLPEKLGFELIEPLRELFKDEVRALGEKLGIPHHILWRHPFPGPGLAVRILGEITPQRLEILRRADRIFIDELKDSGWYDKVWQAFAVLLPVKSVGVMGDERTYAYVIALRAVNSADGMTADWSKLPDDLLARVSARIVNEVDGVNRVVYDITSKPPGTIEWE
ncbi:glutamine-hydrolyzing GMP synthase [bacterium]|nr:glutamine-hydrolyzing GMP synthase [bacterium]